jgi:hypothetical protein
MNFDEIQEKQDKTLGGANNPYSDSLLEAIADDAETVRKILRKYIDEQLGPIEAMKESDPEEYLSALRVIRDEVEYAIADAVERFKV